MNPLGPANGARADKGGNSDAAAACQNGGWQTLIGSDGTQFRTLGDCVSFAAHGGTLVPKQPPVIVSFQFYRVEPGGTLGTFLPVFTGGVGTITLPNGSSVTVTSGVLASVAAMPGDYKLTVTGTGGPPATQTIINPMPEDTGSGGGVDPTGGGGGINLIPTGGLGRIGKAP